MKNFISYSLLIILGIQSLTVSCKSNNKQKKTVQNESKRISTKEATQEQIIHTATQEELIKKHKVKTVKAHYDDDTYTIHHYNQNSLLIKEDYFDGTSLTVSKNSYKLDAEGNILKITTVKDDKKTVKEYSYDKMGRQTNKIITFSDGKKTIIRTNYDDVKHTKTEKSDYYGKFIYYFDERGLEQKIDSWETLFYGISALLMVAIELVVSRLVGKFFF